MHRSKWMRLLAVLFSFAMVAAACGGSDSEDGQTSTDGDASSEPTETTQPSGAVDADAAKDAFSDDEDDDGAMEESDDGEAMEEEDDSAMMEEAGSFADLQAQWDANREENVERISAKIESGEWGLGDDGIVRGAGGFEMDTNACPSDWSNTHGITDSEIRIGHTTAKSGNLAAYGNIGDGMEAYFDYVNENGGIDGKSITLIQKDDAYVAAQTIEFVNELLEAENVFGIQTLGSPNTFSVYDKLNAECTPQLFVMTGHQAWGDPVNHPWTTGLQMSYATESILWGEWIRANLADKLPVVVAGLVMDNDFGLAYEQGMENFAEQNPDVISEFVAVRHDPAAPTLTNEMTTVAAAEPNVFISMTAGNPCLLAIQEADAVGLIETADALFTPSVCKTVSSYMAPAGDASDDWFIMGGGWIDMTDPSTEGDPFFDFMRSDLEGRGLDTAVGLYGTGWGQFGFAQVEALRIAAGLPGGLTRTNWVLAVRHLSLNHPGLLPGIAFEADGNNDSYHVEGSDVSQFDVATQSWIVQGDTIDLNGSSPNCSWDTEGGTGCQ